MKLVRFLALIALVMTCGVGHCPAAGDTARLHTVGGGHDISRIQLLGVYYLPPGRLPMPDWRERLAYYLSRAAKFHERELAGQSRIAWKIHATPFVPATPPRSKDVNDWFWRIAGDVRRKVAVPAPTHGFPIVLIFADTNFCPGYDDWNRTCNPKKCICKPHGNSCQGHVTNTGEERPGTSCGGSRAVYAKSLHIGIGVISGDGWRVPAKGSDCVAYHEGIGHTIGLPHPDPINDTVMGLAQYRTSLNNAILDDAQKRLLGWAPVPIERTDLFSTFSTDHAPLAPVVGEAVVIAATFAAGRVPASVSAQYQTWLGEWTTLPAPRRVPTPRGARLEWTLPRFDESCFVSYRIFAENSPAEREQQWSLFRVRGKQGR